MVGNVDFIGAKKVIYFIAGTVPTGGEAAAIALLQAVADLKLTVQVRSALQPAAGNGDAIETCDYAAGTIPTAYSGVATIAAGTPHGVVIAGAPQ